MWEIQIVTFYRYNVNFLSVWFGFISEVSFSLPQNPVQLTLHLQKQAAFQPTTQNSLWKTSWHSENMFSDTDAAWLNINLSCVWSMTDNIWAYKQNFLHDTADETTGTDMWRYVCDYRVILCFGRQGSRLQKWVKSGMSQSRQEIICALCVTINHLCNTTLHHFEYSVLSKFSVLHMYIHLRYQVDLSQITVITSATEASRLCWLYRLPLVVNEGKQTPQGNSPHPSTDVKGK